MSDDKDDPRRRFVGEAAGVRPIGKVVRTIDHSTDADRKARAEAEAAKRVDAGG